MALSPMMKQYFQLKEKYKDCIIFYRLGDFYEMFFDDAIRGSEILGLTLTGRDCGLEERAPMCGVPYHSVEEYLIKLVKNGEKVAICEQVSNPKKGELVEREIVRIVTAGTIIEDSVLNAFANNYLACVYKTNKAFSVAYADITTGEFYVKYFKDKNSFEKTSDFLIKLNPAEIIGNEDAGYYFNDSPIVVRSLINKISVVSDDFFDINKAEQTIKSQLNCVNLHSLEISDNDDLVIVSGALLKYIKDMQKHTLSNFSKIVYERDNKYLSIDSTAVRNLELIKSNRENKAYGSLQWLLNKTKTSMGARILNNYILYPLLSQEEINERLDAVEAFYKSTLLCENVCESLKEVKDIARLTGKIANGNLTPKDCLALLKSLKVMPSLKIKLLGLEPKLLRDIDSKILDFSSITNVLESAIREDAPALIKDGGIIKEGYNAELDELKNLDKNIKEIIANIESRERESTGIKNLRINFNRASGYYIEVTNSFKDRVPYSYIRRRTLSNCERYITEELRELEEKVLSCDERSIRLEQTLFEQIKSELFNHIEEFKELSDAIGRLDVFIALAIVAKKNDYVRPEILPFDSELKITQGRHPVVEAISKEQFVPNDTLLDTNENKMMIITGPNMAGKSTYMRQVALIQIMAQMGSFVPAKEAKIPLCDKLFTRIGASDNLILDQSTFMVEMNEVASILHSATKNSLLILDEIGRGTSTYDGLSIAWAVVEYLVENIGAKTLFATHYHELTELEEKLVGVKNYKVTVKELNNTIVFLRKIVRGGANRSFGIEVAKLAGVPAGITVRAKTILKELESRDYAKQGYVESEESLPKKSMVEQIIKDIEIDNLTPIEAFNVLIDLKQSLKKGE